MEPNFDLALPQTTTNKTRSAVHNCFIICTFQTLLRSLNNEPTISGLLI